VRLWQTRHEEYPSLYCACGYEITHLRIPAERSAHSARHRAYLKGKQLGKSFPYERIGDDNVVLVSGEETGYASRVVYYLARDFNRQCGFDFVMWPYMGESPIGPDHRAYLYVQDGFAVGLLLGKTTVRFMDVNEPIPALVQAVYTAGGRRREGVARALVERFAGDCGVEGSSLVWDGPVTAAGAALIKSTSGTEAIVLGGGAVGGPRSRSGRGQRESSA
jgi:hypothetical protein